MKGWNMERRLSYQPRKGDKVEGADTHWIQIEVEAVRPDGSWDIGSDTVASIYLTGPDGKQARFHVTVGIDHEGRPWGTLTGIRPNSESTGKACASWLDFAKRAAARIGGGA